MAKLSTPVDQELAWAAACVAHRLNGGYIKWPGQPGQKDNKTLVQELVEDADQLSLSDQELGQQVRDYIGKVATTAALRGTLDPWGQVMARVSQLDTVTDSSDLSVIASMPATYARYLEREKIHTRLAETTGEYTAQLGDKIELDVEVLENKWSQKWATYYVTVVDTDNRAWYFAHRQSLPKGSTVTIRGTVKRIQDRMVQLNRVKLLEKETEV
jgi:hypothetical protein